MSEDAVTEEVVPGSDEYNQQMADKFTGQEEQQADNEVERLPITPMPENGYEKFYNGETGEYDWQNHAKELEYRLNNPQQKQDQEYTEPSDTEVKDIVSNAGLNAESLTQELTEHGDLSEYSYEQLAKQGIGRELVQQYVDNLMYRREAIYNDAMEYVGGQDEWTQMESWGRQNLSEAEVNRYNEILASPEWRIGVDALRARMESSNPEPNLVGGSNTVQGTSFGYRSKAEMKSDMSNPAYRTDPAFRQQVAQKIQSATWDLDVV